MLDPPFNRTKFFLTFCSLTVLLCSQLGSSAVGQENAPKPRPRIGLALAGGSAYGLAHIGVLAWLDKHHIPVDYVAGTSMGGLVGGFYSIGMTPTEMHNLVNTLDWNDALRGEPPFAALPYRRKEDRREIPTRLQIGLRKGIALPNGLDPANPIGLLLSRISLPYSDLKSFDDLPIPFRCVAVDLNSGQAITFKDGSLATALRATMAIPGVFTPVEDNKKLLADGGILNNLPTEAVKAMGADIVIAVDLSPPVASSVTRKSFVDILGRTIDIMVLENERRSLRLADMVLEPDLTGLSANDFTRSDLFAERGFQAAEKKSALLDRLAVSDKEWETYLAARRSRQRSGPLTPAFIAAVGVNKQEARAISSQLRNFVNTPLKVSALERKLTAITGTGRYDSFLYEKAQREGQQGIAIKPHEILYGPPFLSFGLNFQSTDTNDVRFTLAARLTALDVGRDGAESRTDIRLGSETLFRSEYYWPTGLPRWYLAPRLFYDENIRNGFLNDVRLAEYGTRSAGAALDLAYTTSSNSELRIGYEASQFSGSVRTGDPLVLPAFSGPVNVASVRWALDSHNSAIIPTRGVRLATQSRWFFQDPGAVRSYAASEFQMSAFQPFSNRSTLFGIVGLGTTYGYSAPAPRQFTLGGLFHLSAYDQDQFRGNHYQLLTLGYLYKISQLTPALGGKIMLGGWYEFGGAFESYANARYLQDVSVGVLTETLLGPIILGGSIGEGGNSKLFLSVGNVF